MGLELDRNGNGHRLFERVEDRGLVSCYEPRNKFLIKYDVLWTSNGPLILGCLQVYGDSMHKVLHVGPDTCSVVPEFLKEDIEAWGVEPYDLEDASAKCKRLVRKGVVRVADIKFPLPYKANTFSLVLVSDALDLDYLSPRYLNLNPSRIGKACCC